MYGEITRSGGCSALWTAVLDSGCALDRQRTHGTKQPTVNMHKAQVLAASERTDSVGKIYSRRSVTEFKSHSKINLVSINHKMIIHFFWW